MQTGSFFAVIHFLGMTESLLMCVRPDFFSKHFVADELSTARQ